MQDTTGAVAKHLAQHRLSGPKFAGAHSGRIARKKDRAARGRDLNSRHQFL